MDHRGSWASGLLIAATLCLVPAAAGAQATPPVPATEPNATMAPLPAPSPTLAKGTEAWKLLAGNTVVVDGRAANYSEFFTADGVVKHLDKDGKATGKWSLQGQKVCFDYPDEDEKSCVDVEVEGMKGAFVDEDGSRDVFDIVNGNAKNL